jgi:hypothetical protein
MVLSDFFLVPIGLAATLAAVPLILLYLIRPDPARFELPTFRFLTEEQRQAARSPLLERLSRSLLLVLQLLAILLLAVSLAAPYVPVSERQAVEETVLVVDTSASMATASGGESRFDRALSNARSEVTGTNSLVTTAGGGRVTVQRAAPGETRTGLDQLRVNDSPGDLRGAIAQAGAIAGENVRIVILSDFAGEEWTEAVATLRARGLSVTLQQFDRGGGTNVGFVDRRFSGGEVTLSVQNFGTQQVTRTVRLGGTETQVSLGPGDVGTVTLPVPAGGGEATLSGSDDFPIDDRVFVAAPADPAVDVLVLTNDRNRYLTTALDVLDQVDLTVDSPPTTINPDYDVIIYSNIDEEALLPGNVEAGRDLLADGGGVAVQAQQEPPSRLGDLLLIEPTDVIPTPSIQRTEQTDITRGIEFQPPDAALAGGLRAGRALVELDDGSPLIATAERDGGRLLYYGYIESQSTFRYNYQYPVFWKRAVFHLADRQPLAQLNHATGDTVRLDVDTVTGPRGPMAGPSIELLEAGFYEGDTRHSASLLSATESAVAVEPLSSRPGPTGAVSRDEVRTVPQRLTPFAAIAVLVLILVEIGYLRRRGDL